MNVSINIPDEFAKDLQDKFNDFFERVKCDINHSLKYDISMCGNYERETAEMLEKAFEDATILPDDITVGKMIETMFPNVNFGTLAQDDMIVNKDYSNNNEPQVFIPIKVWNSPYKREVKNNE